MSRERCRSRYGFLGHCTFQKDRWPRAVKPAQHEVQYEAASTTRGSIRKSFPHDTELIRDHRSIVQSQFHNPCLIFSDLCDPPRNLILCEIRRNGRSTLNSPARLGWYILFVWRWECIGSRSVTHPWWRYKGDLFLPLAVS